MTQIVANLSEISDRYDAVFCDLWGCLHNGVAVFPEAVAALQAFRKTGGKVVFLTNAPRPMGEVAAQLDTLGCPRDAWDVIVSSGDAAQAAMVAGAVGTSVYHMGPERDLPFFTKLSDGLDASTIARVPLDQAEGIVCTGLVDDTTETPDDYRAQLLRAKTMGLKLLCANPDIVVDRGDQRIYCAGALAALYTEMGGESLYVGKPHPPIYDLARRRLAALEPIPDDRILAIGDGPITDLAGAIGEDLDCLFVTGGLAAAQTEIAGQPDPDKLTAFLAEVQMSPSWAIGRLR
ncbi:TIGR01459 family HAD-type hydrolase [Pseudoruegeria sp. SK021]|uniref:TIGR01459 family HAD-type hydrolase n=1 Tax=Pseudoruegeria sp. SK021 TaxID=1933035 RepID=UPI000A25C725|nr:TIGR01459 family HAD-type hydrolase [Pseudoruegeria sp. SK021]OSP54164.1 HAD family hydrolase [Pseudoruegeria sp. SK021]